MVPVRDAIDDPFRPFVARDDGTTLDLRRVRRFGDVGMRVLMYLLLLLVLGLFALIPMAAWTRGRGVTDALLAVVLLMPTWLVLRLVVWGLRIEGVSRVLASPGVVERRSRGVLLSARDRLIPSAIVATTVVVDTRYGPVRWLQLRARTEQGATHLLDLHLDRDRDPAREAAAQQAAATLAARLRVPLELDAGAT